MGFGDPGGRAKPTAAGPVVSRQAYDVAVWHMNRVAGFPKHARFALGDSIQKDILDLLCELRNAGFGKAGSASLTRAPAAARRRDGSGRPLRSGREES